MQDSHENSYLKARKWSFIPPSLSLPPSFPPSLLPPSHPPSPPPYLSSSME